MISSFIPYSHAYLETLAIEKFSGIAKFVEPFSFIKVQDAVTSAIISGEWGMHDRFRCNLDSNLIEQIKEKYLQDKRVLEIGCGLLQSSESYLFNQFKPQVNWTLSDHASSKSFQEHSKVEAFNLEVGNAFKQKYPVIIGCNTLDAIPGVQLDSSIKAIHDTLEEGGILLHFCNVRMYTNVFISNCSKQDAVLLPASNREQIYRIDRTAYFSIIKANSHLTSEEKIFFGYWGKMESNHQINALSEIYIKYDMRSFFSFDYRIQEIFAAQIEILTRRELFEANIKNACESQGMEMLECYNLEGGNHPTHVFVARKRA